MNTIGQIISGGANSSKKAVRVGIVGGAGYTGGEMIRLLIRHPHVEIVFINSSSNAGNPVSKVHADLVGETREKIQGGPELGPNRPEGLYEFSKEFKPVDDASKKEIAQKNADKPAEVREISQKRGDSNE